MKLNPEGMKQGYDGLLSIGQLQDSHRAAVLWIPASLVYMNYNNQGPHSLPQFGPS